MILKKGFNPFYRNSKPKTRVEAALILKNSNMKDIFKNIQKIDSAL